MQAHELPPPVRMIELLGGFRISQALYAAAALGVADQLVAGPAPVKALAERAGAHAPSLHRLLARAEADHRSGSARLAVRLLTQATASQARRIAASQPADPAALQQGRICREPWRPLHRTPAALSRQVGTGTADLSDALARPVRVVARQPRDAAIEGEIAPIGGLRLSAASTADWLSVRRQTRDQVQYGAGATIGRWTRSGGIGVVCPLGELTNGRRSRRTWSKNAGPVIPPSSLGMRVAHCVGQELRCVYVPRQPAGSSASTSTAVSRARTGDVSVARATA